MYVYQSMKDFLVFLKLTGLKIRDNTAVVDAYDNMSTLVGTDLWRTWVAHQSRWERSSAQEHPRSHPCHHCYHLRHVFCLLLLSFWYMLSELCLFLPVYAFHFWPLIQQTNTLVRILSPCRTERRGLRLVHHSLIPILTKYFRQSPHSKATCGSQARPKLSYKHITDTVTTELNQYTKRSYLRRHFTLDTS